MMYASFRNGTLALIIAFVVTPAIAAPGTWQEPTAGWEAVYEASSDQLPWELSGAGVDKTWTNQQPRLPATPGFTSNDINTPNYVGIVTDSVSGEDAMYMHTASGGNAIASLNVPPGSGGNSDLITVDFKFRLFSDLPADTEYSSLPTTIPLLMTISRPPTATLLAANPNFNEAFLQVRLRRQGLFVLGTNSGGFNTNLSGTTQLGNGWHELRITLNATTGEAQFYLDGSDTADVSEIYFRGNAVSDPSLVVNSVYFGSAGSGIGGSSSVEYVKITSSELVSVVPEPASLGLFTVAGLLAVRRRRH